MTSSINITILLKIKEKRMRASNFLLHMIFEYDDVYDVEFPVEHANLWNIPNIAQLSDLKCAFFIICNRVVLENDFFPA